MRRGSRLTALVLVAAASLMVAVSSSASAPTRLGCAAGTLSGANAISESSALAGARTRFDRGLSGLTASAREAAARLFVTDVEAYLYGYPIVMVRRTVLRFPSNRMVSIGALAGPGTQTVVAPNDDTLYTVGRVDLSGGPIVVQTPPTGGRFSVVQLLDGFTNAAAYLGTGTEARTGEAAVLVAPGWRGTLPAGLAVIRPATKVLWLLGRALVAGTRATAATVRLLSRYSLTPLAAYETGQRTSPIVLSAFPPSLPVDAPSGVAFFTELAADLTSDRPPPRDACTIRAFDRAGVPADAAGSLPSGTKLKTLAAAAMAGPGVLDAIAEAAQHDPVNTRNGWDSTPPDTARFGTDYFDRAVVAKTGLGANTDALAFYLAQNRDSRDRDLNGTHTYTVRFPAGELPPARAFWSLTLYNRRILLYANPLDRYSLGDRSPGLRYGPHGALTITVSHTRPPGPKRSNWLPAPRGPFELYLRLYQPTSGVLAGRWLPPSVVKVR